jgi:hypothetical protein
MSREMDIFRKIDVYEEGNGNTYIVRVLKETDTVLIGSPVRNANKRVRVEKDESTVFFLKDSESIGDISDSRVAKLQSIRTNVPDWVEK